MASPASELKQDMLLLCFVAVVPVTLAIYEYILTFESEVTLVWRSSRSVVKILFILSRYTPFLSLSGIMISNYSHSTSAVACRAVVLLSQVPTVIGILASESILFMRTWALWKHNKWLGIALGTILGVGAIIYVTTSVMWQTTLVLSTDLYGSQAGVCYVVRQSDIPAVTYGVIIVLETFVLVLTVIRMVRQYCLSGWRTFERNLTTVLYYDGIIFFACMFFISITNIVVILTVKTFYKNSLVVLQTVFHSILSCRVLLNLRETQRREQTVRSLSGVVFANAVPADTEEADSVTSEIRW